jgi:anhydro-N-acetylmuramic acid kinase
LDGLDLALVKFMENAGGWSFSTQKSELFPYNSSLLRQLKVAHEATPTEQEKIDLTFGEWIAQRINHFKIDVGPVDLVGVHGHTAVHQPEKKISLQLGSGDVIAKMTKLPVVVSFRDADIKQGGQGAPLVPFGDFTLFSAYQACLNLGGIANISIKEKRLAWDVCPCNQVLNFFAEKLGKNYDEEGKWARFGAYDPTFYESIASHPYFRLQPPKSLPNYYLNPALLDTVEPRSGLHTYVQFVADQIRDALLETTPGKLLITGGGAYNTFLVDEISGRLENWEVVVPGPDLVSFKEAIVFAFLALRRWRGEINTLASVTGAARDVSGGVIHLPE